jgi:hypothetical protein
MAQPDNCIDLPKCEAAMEGATLVLRIPFLRSNLQGEADFRRARLAPADLKNWMTGGFKNLEAISHGQLHDLAITAKAIGDAAEVAKNAKAAETSTKSKPAAKPVPAGK